jgi:hypothetical protein
VAREQCKLAAIVAADVAGYSRLMGRDESGTLAGAPARSSQGTIGALHVTRRSQFTSHYFGVSLKSNLQ